MCYQFNNGEKEGGESDVEESVCLEGEVDTRGVGSPTFSYGWKDAMIRLKSLGLKLSKTQKYTPQGNTQLNRERN